MSFEAFRLAQQGKPFPIPDTEEVPHAPIREIARLHGFRSMLFVPLMNGVVPIGIITVTRLETGAFSPSHIQLLQTFADQAVIAIENVRLFEQVQAKTRDLSEALQQQTATADVLKVISRSAFDLDTVMNTLARSAAKLCDADFSGLFFRDGDFLALRGHVGRRRQSGRLSAARQSPDRRSQSHGACHPERNRRQCSGLRQRHNHPGADVPGSPRFQGHAHCTA